MIKKFKANVAYQVWYNKEIEVEIDTDKYPDFNFEYDVVGEGDTLFDNLCEDYNEEIVQVEIPENDELKYHDCSFGIISMSFEEIK